MKIVDVVCSKARTGFFFDDQRAIKKGAVADGAAYFGETVTPGFKSVRQAGEAISVMLILEDGQIAWGDCAAVQYSGAGGRDPLFLAEDFIPIIEKYIKPELVGKEADSFKGCLLYTSPTMVKGRCFIPKYPNIHEDNTMNATRPVMVLVGAMLVFGERLNLYQWIGVMLDVYKRQVR